MQTIGQSLRDTFANRAWQPEERQAIEDVLDAALAWHAGTLPLKVAAAQGEAANRDGVIASVERMQCAAVLAADPDDPRRAALMAMLDLLVARQPGRTMLNGVYSMADEDLYACRIDPRSLPVRERRAPWEEAA